MAATSLTLAPLALLPVMETAHAGGSRLGNISAATYQTNGRVSVIIVVRNTIYIGGDFTAVRPSGAAPGTREVPRAHLAAFRADNGRLRAWNPGANGSVSALATSADRKVIYVGGKFSKLAGARRHNAGAVKAATGAITRFHANTNGEVLALYRTRSRLYLGGSFTSVKHTHRKRVAALTLGGRLVRTWHPGANNSVRTIQVSRDRTKVFLGGEFNIVNGHNEPHLAKLSSTGKLLPWRLHPGFPVWQIVLTKKRVFAGGNGPGGRIAAYTTGGRKAWSVQTDGGVQTIAALRRGPACGGPLPQRLRRQHRRAADRLRLSAGPGPASPPARAEPQDRRGEAVEAAREQRNGRVLARDLGLHRLRRWGVHRDQRGSPASVRRLPEKLIRGWPCAGGPGPHPCVRENDAMTELPRKAAARTARLAALPLGYAGRNALGLGKRLGGRPAEAVLTEIQQRTAEQLFRTLGELKGGAMKFGQALSVLEAALPEELVGAVPRAAHPAPGLRSADADPDRPRPDRARTSARTGRTSWSGWTAARPRPRRIGQVHQGRWHDGREVAVKVQYPGAGEALLSRPAPARAAGPHDRRRWSPASTSSRWSRSCRPAPTTSSTTRLEAEAQRAFADGLPRRPRHRRARRRRGRRPRSWSPSGWRARPRWPRVIRDGTQEERDHYGELFVRFLFAGPARTGHAARRPAPRQLPDPPERRRQPRPARDPRLRRRGPARPTAACPRRWAR